MADVQIVQSGTAVGNSNGVASFTLANTPQADDSIVLLLGVKTASTLFGVSGGGGGWVRKGRFSTESTSTDQTHAMEVWIGTNLTGPGPVTVTESTGVRSPYVVFVHARGANAFAAMVSDAYRSTPGTLTGPLTPTTAGSLVLDWFGTIDSGTPVWPASTTPASGWTGYTDSGVLNAWTILKSGRRISAGEGHQTTATVTATADHRLVQAVIPADVPNWLGVTQSAATTDSVTVTWSAPSGIVTDGYTVSVDGGALVDVGNVLTYTATGLSAGTHTIAVRAYDDTAPLVSVGAIGSVTGVGTSPAGEGPAQLVDGNLGSKWLIQSVAGSVTMMLATAAAVTGYRITSGNDFPNRDPKSWTLEGSNDGTTWTTVDTRTNEPVWASRTLTREYTVANATAYSRYRWSVTANNGDTITQAAELALLKNGTVSRARSSASTLTTTAVSGDLNVATTPAPATSSGTLSATATAVAVTAAPRTGAGTLSATTVAVAQTTAPTSGSGNLTATAQVIGGPAVTGAALSGSGTLTAAAVAVVPVEPGVELPTDTTNIAEGRTRDGYGVATWEPPVVPIPRMPGEPIREIAARAFGQPVITGTEVSYSQSEATLPRGHHRILMGGRDVTAFRGVGVPPPSYQLAEPLMYGPARIQFPQVFASFEEPGGPGLRFMRKHTPVVIQRVVDGVVVAEDYRGFVLAYDTSGPTFTIECAGEAQGRSMLRDKQLTIFRDVLDLGRLWWRAITDLGLRFEPRLGPETGIPVSTFGGMGHIDYLAALSALGWTRDGNQWTCMPNRQGVYHLRQKDMTTVDFTLFADDTRTVANLRRDTASEYNRVFVSGVTPNGQRVRNGVYPGLQQSKPAPYPFNDNRDFGPGTTNEDTDTGDGISRMIGQLRGRGYLSPEDVPGGYDQDVRRAIEALQDDALQGGLANPGTMDVATWRAMYDLDRVGYDLTDSHIEPMAQRSAVRHYRRSAAGSIMGVNPDWDPHVLPVDETLQMDGVKRQQMFEYAKAELVRESNWVGTITITTGAVLRGDVPVGALITSDDLMDARSIRPGMNARLPLFAGGILVHVSGVDVTDDAVTLTVDTQARDAAKVWEIIKRNRETRNDPARRWRGNRASTEIKDSIDVWDEIGGVLDGDVDLVAGWNVIPVVAGQEGTVSRVRLRVQDVSSKGGTISVQGREFAFAVFGRPITAARLQHLVGNPLAASPVATAEPTTEEKKPPATDPETNDTTDPSTSTPPVKPWWEKRGVAAKLEERDILLAKGTHEEPCGYSPGKKSKGATRTGLERDRAGFTYRTGPQPVLYLAVWVWGPRTLAGGRVMWNQLEAGA